MSAYWVAAEGKQRIPGGRLGGATVTPAGLLHAVDVEDRVQCGVRLGALVAFRDLRWDPLLRGVRCPECRARTADG